MSEKKKSVVPRLRFPEFRDAGPWEVIRIGEVFRVTRGQVLATSLISDRLSTETPYPVYSSQTKNDGLLGYYSDFLYQDSITWTTDGANAGEVKYRKGKFYCTNVCGVLVNEEGYANTCVAEILNSRTKKHVSYVGNPKLMNGVMAQIEIPLPNIEEQQKIADCLSSLDELIELQAKKVEALKQHKKGLLQQLFPREGETTPRLRFPEFRDAGPWEVKKLGEVINTISPPKKLQTTDYLQRGRFPIIDQSPSNFCGWTNDEGALVKADFPLVIFGDHTCVVKLATEPFAQGADGIKILSPTSEVIARFLFQFLQANPVEQKGYKRHFSTLKKMRVAFPHKDTGEQQKIAECLSSLDELIELEAKKLNALKQHKKGLLQQLFPQEVA